MRGKGFNFGTLMAVLLALTVGSSTVLAADCEDLLDNNVYSCTVAADFGGGTFLDCFRFTSPGVESEDFDLSVDGLPGIDLACDCKAKGKPKHPKFGQSKDFYCVSVGAADYGISFTGKASSGGRKIKKGVAVNEYGSSYVFECVEDPACELPPPVGAGNPYRR